MILYNFVVIMLSLLLVAVRTTPVLPETVELMALEEPCVRQGGICVHANNCDPSNTFQYPIDLCPRQRRLGVVCCYS